MLERFLSTKKTPWRMNDLQFQTKIDLQASIEKGDIALCTRNVCLCGSHDRQKIALIDRFGLDFSSYICKRCGLIFTSPYICDSSLPLYYNKFYHPLHFGTAEPKEDLFSKGQGNKIFNFMKAYLNSSNIKIFEIGAGCGTNLLEFANVAKKYNIHVDCYGNEYNNDYVKYGNKKGLKLVSDSIEEYANKTKNRFDVIILSHIFEHLTDPFSTLDYLKKTSHEDTILYIEVPGVLDLKTRYVYDCDFLKYLTHAHVFNFSLSSLNTTLNQCGFELLQSNEKIESVFKVNRHTNNSLSFKEGRNDNYKEILSYLSDLEANLAFYQSKNPANSAHNKLIGTVQRDWGTTGQIGITSSSRPQPEPIINHQRTFLPEEVISNSKTLLAQYKNKHRGQRCVIIGNGPSLNKMDLSFLKDEITFGMNRIYLMFDKYNFRPTYYVSVNPLVIKQSVEDILKIQAPKFLGLNGLPYIHDSNGIVFLKSLGGPSFTKDPCVQGGLWEGYTVTYVAMQLAYFMGFNEVVLIGVDHHFTTPGQPNQEVVSNGDDPNHFHPGYFGKGVRWNLPDLKNSEIGYRLAKQAFEADGRRIIDATFDGKLNIFPKENYKDLFEKYREIDQTKKGNLSETNFLNQQGEHLFNKGDIEGALNAFTKTIEINPNYATAHNNLGVLYWQTGEAQKSVDHFARAIEIDPNNRDAVLNCAEVFKSLGKNEDARNIYSSYLQTHPDDEEIAKALTDLQEINKGRMDSKHINLQLVDSIDLSAINQYCQPPAGNTEKYISVKPIKALSNIFSAYECLKNYYIHGFGKGFKAAESILEHIVKNKLGKSVLLKKDIWNKVIAIKLECELFSSVNGQHFNILKPLTIEDIGVEFSKEEGNERKIDINTYKEKLSKGEDIGYPLYVSGSVLNYIGAKVDSKTIYMMDGARRIAASALNHQHSIVIQLLILEDEYPQILKKERINNIKSRINSLRWFDKYQSIPLLDIIGQRSLKRFELFDMAVLRDQVIIDFGCNTGQSCIKAIQAGALEVWGIEGMPDTWRVACDIGETVGFKNLHYLNVDFNDIYFDQIIDKSFPDKADYSFFFSVYRTKELIQRDRLFKYIINKTKKGVFFEGHAHPKIDTIEYYDWLFESSGLKYKFLGYSEGTLRPLFYIPLEQRISQQQAPSITYVPKSIETSTISTSHNYLVSAIVSTYKSEKLIKGRLKDLLGQTLGDKLEIVVIDSNSPENEKAVVEKYMRTHQNIKYIRTPQRESVYEAWNRGIKAASGKYITNANTDDRLRPDALEILSAELEKHSEIGLVYGDFFITGFENMDFYEHICCGYSLKPDYTPGIMLSGCHMGPQPMWRKSIHEEIGYFDESFKSASDYEFWCRLATRCPMKHISEFLGLYLHNPFGIANSNLQLNNTETALVKQMYKNKLPPADSGVSSGYYYKNGVSNGNYVNICMVTYNRIEFTKKAVASIVKHTRFPHVITVVDNNSEDGTKDYLKQLHKKGIIKNLIFLDENVGVAKASNIAWHLDPEAEYYMKLDNDIVIQKSDWLTNMIKVIKAIPQLGAIAYNFEPSSYAASTVDGHIVRIKNGNLGGACILIPKRTREQLGYWCEDYGLYSEEDADYGARIQINGLYNVYMEDENIGIHLPAGRAAAIDPKTFVAKDGREEIEDAEYRKWKDETRRRNISSGLFSRNIMGYRDGTRPLHIKSTFAFQYLQKKSFDSQQISYSFVSIIIPLFNQLEYTKQCLEALVQNTPADLYEVIIVDNASNDGAKEFLKCLEGDVKIITNEKNLGFAKACNQGARAALGKYLVFLNNDTVPQHGWLEEMIRVAESDDNVGIVGSKLLFPDGTIQHAGVVVSKNKLPYHIYRGSSADITGANKQRDYQIVTAACMLIRSELFFDVGCFDEKYVNGCEDIALCLKVGKNGKRVVYTPKSVLIRHEEKDEMDFNRRLLLNIWKDKIEQDDEKFFLEDGLEKITAPDGSTRWILAQGQDCKVKISIIIVTHNSLSDIKQCVNSIVSNTSLPYELIVVDNSSTDGTQTYLKTLTNAKIILNPTNNGFSKACNQGIKEAKGDYIVLLNPDTAVTRNWDTRMASHFKKGVGAVGPVSNYVAGLQKFEFHSKKPTNGETKINDLSENLYQWNKGKGVETKLLIGFCLMLEKDVIEKIGMLDEDLFLGSDDLEYSWRLRNNGYKLVVATDAFVYHKGQASFKTEPEEKMKQFTQESQDALYSKLEIHYGEGNVPTPMKLWDINWFKPNHAQFQPKPPVSLLTSIIILTHNQLEYTKKCIESIFIHTKEPFELIMVDNSSTDGTVEYLESKIKNQRPEIGIKIIKNKENMGFAVGNNQGMAKAKGSYILLMNNDIVVTPGWLKRLLACAEQKPQIGIVGPVSNYVSGPQKVDGVTYDTTSLNSLNEFSSAFIKKYSGQSKPFWRVVGFCMLIKRAVINKIGGLDGRYGLGNFEDDDFSLRAALAGFESWIAQDCFVHHFGSRTFVGAKIDYRKSLHKNWEIFKHKWGIPAELAYGTWFDVELIKKNGFIPAKHYCPLNYVKDSITQGIEHCSMDDIEEARRICSQLSQKILKCEQVPIN